MEEHPKIKRRTKESNFSKEIKKMTVKKKENLGKSSTDKVKLKDKAQLNNLSQQLKLRKLKMKLIVQFHCY